MYRTQADAAEAEYCDSGAGFDVGTSTEVATLNIGWNQNTSSLANGSAAIGLLDARAGNVDMHLSELNIGRGTGRGSAYNEYEYIGFGT
ncbi:MAG: hypothetical protein ACE5F8_00485, partial [Woeseiaceae bacterium]